MTLIFKNLISLFQILGSETRLNSLALGVALGFVLGLSPVFSLQSILIFIILLVFRIQFSMAMVSMGLFKLVAYFLDPLFHKVGSMLLELESLKAFWTSLYNAPAVVFTHFNNSVVMGAGVVGFILSPFVFIVSRFLIKKYRSQVVKKFQNTKFWNYLKKTTLINWYFKYEKFRS